MLALAPPAHKMIKMSMGASTIWGFRFMPARPTRAGCSTITAMITISSIGKGTMEERQTAVCLSLFCFMYPAQNFRIFNTEKAFRPTGEKYLNHSSFIKNPRKSNVYNNESEKSNGFAIGFRNDSH